MQELDVLIIGAGTAGEDAASSFLGKGRTTGLVERGRTGGACIFNACIPTKALVTAARLYGKMRGAGALGLPACEAPPDYRKVKAFKDGIVESIGQGRDERWEGRGARIFHGEARFESPHEVAVGDELIHAEHILITTGSLPAVPPIPGLADAGYITNIEAMDVEIVPERLAVIGGGPVGLEFAQIFSAFGASVGIFESGSRILPREDEEVSQAMAGFLEERGVAVLTGASISQVSTTATGKLITFERNGGADSREFDEILVGTGRRPDLRGLNLEASGVKTNGHGIEVNDGMQTNVPHIWAAGDVTGLYQFTLIAWEQGAVAAANAMGEGPRSLNYDILPRVTFCDPEVASVGITEQQALEAGLSVQIGRFNYADLSRGILAGETAGFFKLVAEAGSGRILGGHIVGTESSSLIHEVAAAMAAGMTARQVGDTLHAYPTFSEGVRYACQAIT